MSAQELRSTLVMCSLPSTGDMSMLPQWFRDCVEKGTREQYQPTIIRKWLTSNYDDDDADLPFTATVLKMIRKRN